jgi:phosphoketolase
VIGKTFYCCFESFINCVMSIFDSWCKIIRMVFIQWTSILQINYSSHMYLH